MVMDCQAEMKSKFSERRRRMNSLGADEIDLSFVRSVLLRVLPGWRGAVFGPEDVVEGGRLGSEFAEAGEALSAMVLAVHDDLGESLGDGGLGFQEGQVESPLEIAFGEVGDEGELLFVGGAVEVD